jgi:hypothetical protein
MPVSMLCCVLRQLCVLSNDLIMAKLADSSAGGGHVVTTNWASSRQAVWHEGGSAQSTLPRIGAWQGTWGR